MSDAKWIDTIAGAMQVSKALTCAVRANATNYLAKAAGATTTPHQAYEEYSSALRHLQRDLYHPVKQKSNETLFTVLLLGIFDVYHLKVEIDCRFIMVRTLLHG
jgi:Fungal specific transcription factor domain